MIITSRLSTIELGTIIHQIRQAISISISVSISLEAEDEDGDKDGAKAKVISANCQAELHKSWPKPGDSFECCGARLSPAHNYVKGERRESVGGVCDVVMCDKRLPLGLVKRYAG